MVSFIALIARVESDNDGEAMRFEEAVYHDLLTRLLMSKPDPRVTTLIQQIKHAHNWLGVPVSNMSDRTALMIAATSWGQYQMLGETIYGLGLSYSIREYLCDERGEQDTSFNSWCAKHDIPQQALIASWDDAFAENFATKWNGPGNVPAYTARMKSNYQLLGGKL